MKLSRKWLDEFTDINASPEEYANKMTMSGSKVEITEDPGAEITRVVVGLVTKIERHENSDHLWVCKVDAGQDELLTIVTGAQNVNAGDYVPVALNKSTLPGGVTIKKGKLRGVKSEGMLCSLSELNLDLHDFPDAEEDGIFILKEEGLTFGEDIKPIIGKDDSIVEFEITNNRPDCFSMIGLARESAVTFGTEVYYHTPKVTGSGGDISEYLDVDIANPELCPRYTARVVKNIKIGPSPKWMRQRLRALGVRPISNIVDITNYVMLEYGQPMHAFDYACINGSKIIVRTAKENEIMTTLDGIGRKLNSTMLVIADETKAVGIAGVMGGENSEITDDTEMVVFESANFNGTSIRKTATALGMRTDASSRYEKGLDPLNTLPAIERACELVELLGAGEVVNGYVDVVARDSEPVKLTLEPDAINTLLGTEIPEQFMRDTLESLGFELNGYDITVPSWRLDIECTADIAEEVARFYGYDKIEPTMITSKTVIGGLTTAQRRDREAGALLRGMGFSEIITYSFISPGAYDKIRLPEDSPLRESATIQNPLGEDSSIMRTTSLPSMLETLSLNNGFRNAEARLYEMAPVYLPDGSETLCDERIYITLGAYGGDMDFYCLKGAIEAILKSFRIEGAGFVPVNVPTFHPGRTAEITCDGGGGSMRLGIFGQIHPLTAKNYGIDAEVYCAELDFYKLLELTGPEPEYVPLPRFPSVTRDIAVVCDMHIQVAQLEKCIKNACGGGGGLLKEVRFFDVYTGAQVAEGKKSVAFSLVFRADDRTLTDEMADEGTRRALDALASEFNAVIR